VGADLNEQLWQGVYATNNTPGKMVVAVEVDSVDEVAPRISDVVDELGRDYELIIDNRYLNDDVRQELDVEGIKEPVFLDEEDTDESVISIRDQLVLEGATNGIYFRSPEPAPGDEQFLEDLINSLNARNLQVTSIDNLDTFNFILQNNQGYDFVLAADPATAEIAMRSIADNGLRDQVLLATRGVNADIAEAIARGRISFADQTEYRQGMIQFLQIADPNSNLSYVESVVPPLLTGSSLHIYRDYDADEHQFVRRQYPP
jgi:hypothetical protein